MWLASLPPECVPPALEPYRERPDLAARLQIPFATTSLLISLYLAFSMGVSFARRRDLDVLCGEIGYGELLARVPRWRPE